MRILADVGYIDSAVTFYELTDEQLEYVRGNKDYWTDPKYLNECVMAKGSNAHIITLFNNTAEGLIETYSKLLETYKTVSWWDRDMNKFYIKRG